MSEDKIDFETAKIMLRLMRADIQENYYDIFYEKFERIEGFTNTILGFIQTLKLNEKEKLQEFSGDIEDKFKKFVGNMTSEIHATSSKNKDYLEYQQSDPLPAAKTAAQLGLYGDGSIEAAMQAIAKLSEEDKLLYLQAYQSYFNEKFGGDQAIIKFVQLQSKQEDDQPYQLNPREDLFRFRNFLPIYGREKLIEYEPHVNNYFKPSFANWSEAFIRLYRQAYFEIKKTNQEFEQQLVNFLNSVEEPVKEEDFSMEPYTVEKFKNYIENKIVVNPIDEKIDVKYWLDYTSQMPQDSFDHYKDIFKKRAGTEYLMHYSLAYFAGYLKADDNINFDYREHDELFDSFLQSPMFKKFHAERLEEKRKYNPEATELQTAPLGYKTAEASGEVNQKDEIDTPTPPTDSPPPGINPDLIDYSKLKAAIREECKAALREYDVALRNEDNREKIYLSEKAMGALTILSNKVFQDNHTTTELVNIILEDYLLAVFSMARVFPKGHAYFIRESADELNIAEDLIDVEVNRDLEAYKEALKILLDK